MKTTMLSGRGLQREAYIGSPSIGDEQVCGQRNIWRLSGVRQGCLVVAQPLPLLLVGGLESPGLQALALGSGHDGECGLPAGVVDEREGAPQGFEGGTLALPQHILAAAARQVLPGELGWGGAAPGQLPCYQAGGVLRNGLGLLLLLVQLSLQAHPACIAQRLVAVRVVSPHRCFGGSALGALLQSTATAQS